MRRSCSATSWDLRVRLRALQVKKVLTRDIGFRVIAGGEPCLGQMRLIHVVGHVSAPIFVGTQPVSNQFEKMSGQSGATAKASIASWNSLSA
jgi:hypothetical protein